MPSQRKLMSFWFHLGTVAERSHRAQVVACPLPESYGCEPGHLAHSALLFDDRWLHESRRAILPIRKGVHSLRRVISARYPDSRADHPQQLQNIEELDRRRTVRRGNPPSPSARGCSRQELDT